MKNLNERPKSRPENVCVITEAITKSDEGVTPRFRVCAVYSDATEAKKHVDLNEKIVDGTGHYSIEKYPILHSCEVNE